MRSSLHLIAAACALAAPVFPAETYSPDTGALALVTEQVNRGDFGKLELKRSDDAKVRLLVNDEVVETTGRVFLISPGEQVMLRGEAIPGAPQAAGKNSFDDRGMFRSTNLTETVWEAETEDRLLKSPDGSVEWRPGNGGKASYVSVEIARLDIYRPGSAMAAEDQSVPATLSSGRAGVLLVPGVAFDRNGDGMLGGENIGIYPNERGADAPNSVKSRAEVYAPPSTFYLIDERAAGQKITSALTLGDLAPRVFEGDTGPRYAPFSPRLIQFLDTFEGKVKAAGLDPNRLFILRGFVSPTDRRRLERQGVNLAEFTRFQYGDAVAMVYDTNKGARAENTVPVMNDINGDGAADAADVAVLAKLAKETMDALGIYGAIGSAANFEGPGPSKGTPYLHVDLRGWYVPLDE